MASLPLFVTAQKFSFVVVDKSNGVPLQNVVITIKPANAYLITNSEGRVEFSLSNASSVVELYKLGYIKQSLAAAFLKSNDTIALVQKLLVLDEVVVSDKIKKTAVKDKRFFISDFIVLPNNSYLLSTYSLNKKGFDLIYYKNDDRVLQKFSFKNDEFCGLFTDCVGGYQVVTEKKCYQAVINSDSTFYLMPAIRRGQFDTLIKPCALKTKQGFVFSVPGPTFVIPGEKFETKVPSQYLNYHYIENKSPRLLCSYGFNEANKEMMASDASMRAMGKMANESAQAIESKSSLFFEQGMAGVYAPIFQNGDTIIVFDFQQKKIDFMLKDGKPFRQVRVAEKWYSELYKFSVVKDEAYNKYYFVQKDNSTCTVTEINIYSFTQGKRTVLEHVFAKEIAIFGGKIYFIQKENGWDDTSYIYYQYLN